MIQLNIARFAKLDRWLAWELKQGGIFVRFPEQEMSLHTLFFVHKNIQFKHMFNGMNIIDTGVIYPPGITRQSHVYEFLMNEISPLSIEVTLRNGQKKYLRNRACDDTVKIIKKQIQNPASIYKRLQNYMGQNSEINSIYSPKINFFLNQFYLRLTGMTHIKMKNIPLNSKISPSLTSDILNHIGEQYENHSPASIKRVERQKELIMIKINSTQKQINAIEEESDRKVVLYKYGVIFVTFAHMVSFGYMIFFVDWLGWDIIEPLTYSVGVFYTLLGIRFYRKYKTDRTLSNIKEILQKIVMKPASLVHLRELKNVQEIQRKQLKRIETKAALLNNRVNFRTSLVDSFSQYSKEQK